MSKGDRRDELGSGETTACCLCITLVFPFTSGFDLIATSRDSIVRLIIVGNPGEYFSLLTIGPKSYLLVY